MSQKTAEKTTETKTENTKKANKTGAKGDVVSSRETTTAREKTVWTLERCQRYARRFSTEVMWASGAPASYKSAVAHGWLAQCLTAMSTANSGQKGGKVITANFKKSSPTTETTKKAA